MPRFEQGPNQEPLPEMDVRSVIEGMSHDARARYKQELLRGIDDRERLIWMINDVEDGYGLNEH